MNFQVGRVLNSFGLGTCQIQPAQADAQFLGLEELKGAKFWSPTKGQFDSVQGGKGFFATAKIKTHKGRSNANTPQNPV